VSDSGASANLADAASAENRLRFAALTPDGAVTCTAIIMLSSNDSRSDRERQAQRPNRFEPEKFDNIVGYFLI
ncbi:MAG: hypothetical protein WBE78_08155, partial [Candidatus Binataceae bacterium]